MPVPRMPLRRRHARVAWTPGSRWREPGRAPGTAAAQSSPPTWRPSEVRRTPGPHLPGCGNAPGTGRDPGARCCGRPTWAPQTPGRHWVVCASNSATPPQLSAPTSAAAKPETRRRTPRSAPCTWTRDGYPRHAPRTGRPWTWGSPTPGTVCCRRWRPSRPAHPAAGQPLRLSGDASTRLGSAVPRKRVVVQGQLTAVSPVSRLQVSKPRPPSRLSLAITLSTALRVSLPSPPMCVSLP